MPGQDRAERDEVGAGRACDEARQRRLAGAGRAPQDDRLQAIFVDGAAQRPARADERLLADEFVERPRTHAFGQRSGRARRGRRGLVVKQRHWTLAAVRWRRHAAEPPRRGSGRRRRQRSATRPARRIGMVSRSSAPATTDAGRPGPSPPSRIAQSARRSHAGSGVPPVAVVAMTRSPADLAACNAASSGTPAAIGMRNVLPIASAQRLPAEWVCTASRDHDPRRTAALRRANDRADIARILNLVHDHDQRGVAAEDLLDRRVAGAWLSPSRPDGCLHRTHGANHLLRTRWRSGYCDVRVRVRHPRDAPPSAAR